VINAENGIKNLNRNINGNNYFKLEGIRLKSTILGFFIQIMIV